MYTYICVMHRRRRRILNLLSKGNWKNTLCIFVQLLLAGARGTSLAGPSPYPQCGGKPACVQFKWKFTRPPCCIL